MTAVTRTNTKTGAVSYLGSNLSDSQKANVAAGNATVGYEVPKTSSTSSGAVPKANVAAVVVPKKTNPVVLTSSAAKDHMANVVQPALDQATAGIAAQKVNVANQKSVDEQTRAANSTVSSDNALRQAKIEEIRQKGLLIQKELQDGIDPEPASNAASKAPTNPTTSTTTPTQAGANDPYNGTREDLAKANDDYQAKADAVSKSILDIQNGVVPFTEGENAQIQGLQQQFGQLINQQQLLNTTSSGIANVRGYQTGSAEYDPNFQIKTIGSIVTAGNMKIADLNTRLAAATADLEQSFKDNKISAIKDSYSIFQEASKERRAALKDTIDATSAAIKDVRDRQDKKDDVLEQTRKAVYDLAVKNGAPASVISAIGQSSSPDEMYSAITGYGQDPLDVMYKRAQIQKIYSDMAETQQDPSQILAYAQQYASTGKIPTGLPKGAFGAVAQAAKELPKQPGQILDTNTGVNADVPAATADAYAALYSAVELSKQLKELDAKRWDSLLGGLVTGVTGDKTQEEYTNLRAQVVDLLARARSGAALTADEEKRYSSMLPGRFSDLIGNATPAGIGSAIGGLLGTMLQTFGSDKSLGVDSSFKIDNFTNALSSDLKNKASSHGWAVNGISTVNVGGSDYTVGDVISNDQGQYGRINADGSITVL